ncbi:sp110 nuclear body protein isoform X1 [Oryzias latipes]|uniref:SP110 nuclear body protein, tandem duplicate 1 n=1 Tax=Oryzias latipes TaxID=8090 RepID=H2MDN0_ORYLA|nr:sp110 nuclear body protein isoform X1 [Oryzias latipes]
MDPLDFLESAQLQRFFQSRKTELSCLENPQTFLSQLRDYNIIPEDRYKKVINMKSKDKTRMAIRKILEWLERERSEHIRLFWRCVFKEIILSQYPILRQMRNSLMDGSFLFDGQLPPTVEKEEKGKKKNTETSSVKNKKISKNTCGDEEQPGTSSHMTPCQKKSKKVAVVSPKKGEKIWTSPNELPVTCGNMEGTLFQEILPQGSFQFNKLFPTTVEKEEKGKKMNNEASSAKNKKRSKNTCGDKEQPGTSSQMTPCQKKFKKTAFASPNKGEEIWTLPTFKNQLPVPCRNMEGILNQDILAQGSFQFNKLFPTTVKKEEKGKKKKKEASSVKNKKISKNTCGDKEQPGTSSQMTPCQKKSKKTASAVPKKEVEIWTLPTFENQKPVTCGNMEGTLNQHIPAQGSFQFNKLFPTTVEKEEKGKKKNKEASSVKNKKRSKNTCGDEEQPGTSSQMTPCQKKSKTIAFASPNKGEEIWTLPTFKNQLPVPCRNMEGILNQDILAQAVPKKEDKIWTSPTFKNQLPVTCGNMAGILFPKKLAQGEKCIQVMDQWFTPLEFQEFAGKEKSKNWKLSIKYEDITLGKLIQEGHLKSGTFKKRSKRAKVLSPHSLLCKCSKCKVELKNKDTGNQKNYDECYICKDVGDLVKCDDCPKYFHQNCHLPHIEEAMMSDNTPWMCTFCIFEIIQNSRYNHKQKREVVLSRQVSQHMVECQYLLLFLRNTDPELNLENYRCFVETLTWVDKIADKLQENQYKTVGQFESDVQLILANCVFYNRDNAEFLEIGKRLKETFDKEFKKAFNIVD